MTCSLLFTTLFPNAEQPAHGIFVENRLRNTLATGGIESAVMAPVPFFPSRSKEWGRYGAYARVPRTEHRFGVSICHPRFVVVPKIGTSISPWLLYGAARRAVRRQLEMGLQFDVIDAHYFYPDGVAAALLAREFRRPLVITGRGSDLTLLPNQRLPRAQIRWAADAASALVTVSASLKQALVGLGVCEKRVAVLRNGVETDLFRPLERGRARAQYGVTGFTLLSVGGLIPRKGHEIAIDALTHLPACELLIAGAGPLRAALERRADALGVGSRVRFLGEVAHRDLPQVYNAADAMVLMSDREGWANVILESLACGTPVIATDVGAAREIIRDAQAGCVLEIRSAQALVNAVDGIRRAPPERAKTRRYAEAFGWGPVAAANAALLQAAGSGTLPPDIAREFSVDGPS